MSQPFPHTLEWVVRFGDDTGLNFTLRCGNCRTTYKGWGIDAMGETKVSLHAIVNALYLTKKMQAELLGAEPCPQTRMAA